MTVKRLLGTEEFQNCINIIKIHTKISGTKPTPIENLVDVYSKYFVENDNYLSFGYFEDEVLISFILIAFIENKSMGKFWIIVGFYSTKRHNIFSFNNPEIGSLIKQSFETAEERGYYEYYYSIAEHIAKVYEAKMETCKYLKAHRYHRIILDVVPKNTTPELEFYKKLLGNDVKPHNIVIKKRILKEEYRKKSILN